MKFTKKQAKEAAIEAGRAKLFSWLSEAIDHGIIWSQTETTSSGMTRYVKLYRVTNESASPEIDMLWPGVPALDRDAETTLGGYSDALTVVARDWGFDFKKRAFVVKGTGFNAVYDALETLGYKAGLDKVAAKVKREILG